MGGKDEHAEGGNEEEGRNGEVMRKETAQRMGNDAEEGGNDDGEAEPPRSVHTPNVWSRGRWRITNVSSML
jgi:hypothetical protein